MGVQPRGEVSSKNYRDLIVWQRALDLVTEVYAVSRRFAREETYGLLAQVRRAAVSIPSNIAEGPGRRTRRELFRSLSIAHGSLRELETQLTIATRLAYIESDAHERLMSTTGEVGRVVTGLANSLQVPK